PHRSRHSFPTRRSSDLLAFALNSPVLAADHNLAGTWKASFTTESGQAIESTLKLKQDGDKLSGVAIGRNGNETPLDEISLTGDRSEEHTSELQSRGHLV